MDQTGSAGVGRSVRSHRVLAAALAVVAVLVLAIGAAMGASLLPRSASATATPSPTNAAAASPTPTPTPSPSPNPYATEKVSLTCEQASAGGGSKSQVQPGGRVSMNLRRPRWLQGGPAQIVVDPVPGSIIRISSGYLARVVLGTGVGTCWSPDLVQWHSVDNPAVFSSSGPHAFQPVHQIPVETGYAALDLTGLEWYTPDGVHWAEGVPGAVRIAEPTPPAGMDCSFSIVIGGCAYTWGITVRDGGDSGAYEATFDNGGTWGQMSLPAGVDVIHQIVRLANGRFIAWGEWIDPRRAVARRLTVTKGSRCPRLRRGGESAGGNLATAEVFGR